MFDIDAGKLLIIGVIALVVLGPKELPRVLRQVGAIIGKMRRMAGEFQTQFMDAMKESEMEELKKDVQKIADQARVDINYDPVSTTDREIRDAIDGRKPESAAATALTPAADPDNAIYTVDIPPPPATPDAAAVVSAENRPAPAPAAAPEPIKKPGEA